METYSYEAALVGSMLPIRRPIRVIKVISMVVSDVGIDVCRHVIYENGVPVLSEWNAVGSYSHPRHCGRVVEWQRVA